MTNLLKVYKKTPIHKLTKNQIKLFDILHELIGRSGFDELWHECDDNIKEEILQSWLNIIKS